MELHRMGSDKNDPKLKLKELKLVAGIGVIDRTKFDLRAQKILDAMRPKRRRNTQWKKKT